MGSLFITVQYGLLFISATSYLVNAEEKDSVDTNHRDSDIDRGVPGRTELGYTTRCYEDIPPLSIDVDGAPTCAPVVYGSEHDLNSEDNIKTDDEVKKLREEFFKKHRKDNAIPDQTKNEAQRGVKSELEKIVVKKLTELDNQKENGIQKLDLKEGDNIVKQHWNADNEDFINAGEEAQKEHWNIEPIEKLNNKDKRYKPIPHADSEPGYKHDTIQREIHEEIYGDTSMNNIKKMNIISEKKVVNKLKLQHKDHQNVHKINNIKDGLKNLLNLKNLDKYQKQFKNYKKIMGIELRETTNPYQKEKIYGPSCGLKKLNWIKIDNDKRKQLVAHILNCPKHIRNEIWTKEWERCPTKSGEFQSSEYECQSLSLVYPHPDPKRRRTTLEISPKPKSLKINQKPLVRQNGINSYYVTEKSILGQKNVLQSHKKAIKLKRRKRNIKSTKHPKSKKTTKYFMDIDGRFRDIDEIEMERNKYSSEEAKATQPNWIHDDGYRPKTEKKFRPRPTINYNRVPKEPLDYGSYDKSEHWRMMTELITEGTLPAKFYDSLSIPNLPDTKEAYDVCRENFTTSECFRYPDISRLRDTREKKFMKKYYHKDYPELDMSE